MFKISWKCKLLKYEFVMNIFFDRSKLVKIFFLLFVIYLMKLNIFFL